MKGHWYNKETGASLPQGKPERVGLFSVEKAQGEFINICKYMKG